VRFKADIGGEDVGVWINPAKINLVIPYDEDFCEMAIEGYGLLRVHGLLDEIIKKIDPPPVFETPVIMNTNHIIRSPKPPPSMADRFKSFMEDNDLTQD